MTRTWTNDTAQAFIDSYCNDEPLPDAVERLMRSSLTPDDADRINEPGGEQQDEFDSVLYDATA